MNVLSLFSGVGGFDLGLENAGMKTIYQCEWDKHANSILERHWPTVPRWGDISTLTAKEILSHGTPPDVVAWGSPCQDLSVAGKRAGLEGERSGLFHEGIRIINELRKETNNEYPRISIWENVAGALSSNRGADFGVILDEMAKAGAMVIEWALLDAQHFGIPQRRRRVFLIAIFNSATASNCPSPLLPVGESLPRDTAKGKSKGQEASGEITESLGAGSEWWDGGQIADALTTTSNEQRMPDKKRLQVVVQETPTRLLGSDIIGSLNATDYKWPQNQQLDENKFIVTEPMLLDIQRVGDIRVYAPPVQALQARMGTGGNSTPMVVELPMAVRRLTPLECERLMGWPDDHTRYKADGTEQADTHRYKQCGNGVASPVAEWIGKQLMKLDEAPQ
jgi:DNA (cytosine-5)-methyltransferase 1